MKIEDLAHLVAIINHIPVVINDKSVTNRDEFSILNNLRTALNKKFVQGLKSLKVGSLFEDDNVTNTSHSVVITTNPSTIETVETPETFKILEAHQTLASVQAVSKDSDKQDENAQLELPLETAITTTTQPSDTLQKQEGKTQKVANVSSDPEYVEALKRQKEALKSQGRSNRRIKNDQQKG